MDRAEWVDYKRKVNASKSRIKVALADASVFRDPGKDDLIPAIFFNDMLARLEGLVPAAAGILLGSGPGTADSSQQL